MLICPCALYHSGVAWHVMLLDGRVQSRRVAELQSRRVAWRRRRRRSSWWWWWARTSLCGRLVGGCKTHLERLSRSGRPTADQRREKARMEAWQSTGSIDGDNKLPSWTSRRRARALDEGQGCGSTFARAWEGTLGPALAQGSGCHDRVLIGLGKQTKAPRFLPAFLPSAGPLPPRINIPQRQTRQSGIVLRTLCWSRFLLTAPASSHPPPAIQSSPWPLCNPLTWASSNMSETVVTAAATAVGRVESIN